LEPFRAGVSLVESTAFLAVVDGRCFSKYVDRNQLTEKRKNGQMDHRRGAWKNLSN
jgi:hypothetical protein